MDILNQGFRGKLYRTCRTLTDGHAIAAVMIDIDGNRGMHCHDVGLRFIYRGNMGKLMCRSVLHHTMVL